MPREQDDEREDDDSSKSHQPSKQVTPALAGLTTLLAASPILSVSPGKEVEEEPVHERKCIRIPGDDGVIIPLHGDSDEEINPERYADPAMITMQKTDEPTVEKPKPKPPPATRQRKDKSPKRTKKKSKPDDTEKLVLPALAGLATVIAATPIITEPAEVPETKKEDDSQVRKFIRTSNESTLIVPLHGDSDEDINPERYSDPSLLSKQPIDGPVIEEYVPKAKEEARLSETQSKIVEEPPEKKPSKKKAAPQPPSKDSPQTLPALAGLTTLLAASPMLSTTPPETDANQEAANQEVHERKYIRIPNGEGVIIPLHGDSDEEINPDRYKDPSLIGVQKVGEVIVEDRKHTKKSIESKDTKLNHSKNESKKDDNKSLRGKTVMPLLAGMTTLLAASPILAVSPPAEKEETEDVNIEESKAETNEVHERKFIRIPNQEGVIIPLHGDSDEEINPERYEDPSLQGVQRIGDVVEEIKQPKVVKSVESKAIMSKDSKDSQAPSGDKNASSGGKLVTPMLAGLTTLLAASPILTVSPSNEENSGEGPELQPDNQEQSETIDDKPIERKVIKLPNKADGVIIPLHGDSDEELHPERYEDPSMSVIEKIEGPTMADIIPPAKEKKSKVVKIKKTAVKAKQEAAKMVTPMLAGMTTLLAASPMLTGSPSVDEKMGESNEVDGKENKTEAEGVNSDAPCDAPIEDKPLERKVIRIPDRKDIVIVPLHGDSDEELHPERYEDPSLSVIEIIEGPTIAEIIKPTKAKKSTVVKMKDKAEKAKKEASKMVTPMLAGMTTLLAASPILTVSPSPDESKDDVEVDKDVDSTSAMLEDKPIERKVIRMPDNDIGVIVPLHGDSDEEIHPERYEDPSLTIIQKIEGPTMAEIIKPLDLKPKKSQSISKAAKIKHVAENATKEAAQMVTPMLYGMATLLAGSKEKDTKGVDKGKDEEDNDKEKTKHEKVETRDDVDHVEQEGEREEKEEEEEEIERMFIRMPNQEGLIVPLHGESDEELHPDRYENPEFQGVHSIAGSVVEEGILPPAKPIRSKTKPKPETPITSETEEKQSINKEVHLARDHEYEPVNPREPPPSPPAAVRKSRADEAEEKKTVASALLKSASFDTAETNQVEKSVEKAVEKPTAKPVEKPETDPSSKQVTSSLAGLTTLLAASPILSVSPPQEKEEEVKEEVLERKFIRIPDDSSSIIIPLHGDSDEELHPDRYKDPSLQGIQRIEGPTLELPKAKKPTASKDSEYEVVGSPDDMAIDEAQPLSLQDRFKAGAGDIRDKFRNMQVPKISIERPDLSKIKLPERPQFLKEKPQFLKERPQFMKERPQFLKERPQFLKERPQFLKERPQFLKEKPKFLSQRPNFNVTLPDRSKFKVPERFKFKRSAKTDKPKIRKPNPSSMRRPLRDVVTISSGSSPSFFDTLKEKTGTLKAKAYPKFLSLRRRTQRERVAQLRAQTSLDTESSPPSPPDNRRLFPERYRDIRFADEEEQSRRYDQRMDVQSEEGYEENTAPFHEQEVPTKAKIDSSSDIGESDKEQISSGASSMRHRQGVLEEIDSDEFFLRQKGLSREDVDVSRYLSKEIRDAFRPPKPAVSHMDSTEGYDDEFEDEESLDIRYQTSVPEPPGRKRSAQRSESRESDFNTFPIRPTRRKHSEGSFGPEFGSKEVFEKVKKPPRKYRSKSDMRSSLRSLDRRSLDRRSIMDYATPRPPSRQKSLRSLTRSRPESATDVRGGSVRRDVAHGLEIAPVKPLRKSRSRGASVDERTSRGADSLPHDYVEYDQEEEEIDVDEPELEMELDQDGYEIQEQKTYRVVPVATDVTVGSAIQDDESIPGYATVRKPRPPRPPPPPKSRKEQLQSQLHSIKAHGINFFQTFPRRAMKSLNKPRLPVRPRYPTQFSPVRPPRRNRVFREPVYVEGDLQDDKDMKDSYDLKHDYEEARDLQRGEIVEKMKSRPLPPPPRPPRKRDDSVEDELEDEDIENEGSPIPEKPSRTDEFLSSLRVSLPDTYRDVLASEEEIHIRASEHPTIESSQQTSFEMPDVSVSIQTDPLPAGYTVDDHVESTQRNIPELAEEVFSRREAALSQREAEVFAMREAALSQREAEVFSRREEALSQREAALSQREAELSQHDSRRLFDPDVVRESEALEEDIPPPLPQRAATMIPPPITIPPVQVSFPDKLHLAQLDVDKLNVNELQANKIKVSDIESVTMQISEISGASGNLILNGVELPPDFIKNLVAQIPVPEPPKPVVVVQEKIIERVRETTPQPHMKRMVTPPPPIVVQHAAQSAEEAPSPPVMQASTTEQIPKPVTVRTRRKSPTRVVDDIEDDFASVINERERRERQWLDQQKVARESQVESRSRLEQPTVKSESQKVVEPSGEPKTEEKSEPQPSTSAQSEPERLEPTAFNLIKQLCALWYRNIMSGAECLVGGINSIFPENDKRRDAQTAAVILIVIVAALILLSLGADQSVHHHHWDYLNPPR